MSRYFVDISDGVFIRDDVGMDFGSLEDVRNEAGRRLADYMRDKKPPLWGRNAIEVIARDASDRVILTFVLDAE